MQPQAARKKTSHRLGGGYRGQGGTGGKGTYVAVHKRSKKLRGKDIKQLYYSPDSRGHLENVEIRPGPEGCRIKYTYNLFWKKKSRNIQSELPREQARVTRFQETNSDSHKGQR